MFRLMKRFIWYDWLIAISIFGLTIFQVWIELKLPEYMGSIIGVLTQPGLTPTKALIWQKGGTMIGIVLGSVAITIVTSCLASFVATGLARRVRRDVFSKVGSFSLEEMNRFSTPSLITRSTNDVTQIQQVMGMMLRMALYAPTMAIMAVVKIVNLNMQLTLTTGIAIVVMVGLVMTMLITVVPKFKIIQKLTDKLNGVTRENLTGIRVVRAYSAENIQEDKFDGVNKKLTKTTLFTNRMGSIIMPGMSLIINGLSLAILWVGAYLLKDSVTSYSVVTQFSQYSIQVLMSFMFVALLFIMLPRASVSARRILAMLNTKTKIHDGEYNVENNKAEGEIEFRNVSFKYPDAEGYILHDISFKANKGETVAFIGSTGSGKSTLINLIPRFYDVSEGEVLLDGVNVKEYKLADLNNKIGYVPQKGVLFSGTVDENICYGKEDATEEEIKKALKVAQASNFVGRLENGRNYHISQGGKNVSGGQRQRLSIARAVIKKPEIYIFDDSFSALDYKTDKALREALKKETSEVTNLIVAQRIGTIMDADRIIVLDKGKMVGMGKHKELLKNCKVYKEIAYSQLSKEELA